MKLYENLTLILSYLITLYKYVLWLVFFRQSTGNSWADKVRGKTYTSTNSTVPEAEEPPPSYSLPSPPPPVTSQNGLSASEADTDGSTTIEGKNADFIQNFHS